MNLAETAEWFSALFAENSYLQALITLASFLVLAKIADIFVSKGISRLAGKTHTDLDDKLIALLHRPIFLTIVLIGMRVSLGLITPQAGPQIGGVERTTATLITTLIIILWIVFGIRASTLFISWMSRHRRRFQMVQSTSQPLFEVAAKLILVGLAVYLVLIVWDKDPAAWLASAGILALALGLAAQETLSNVFGGISILADSSFKVGDYIVIDRVDRGRVTRIGLRSTRILTRDDIEITVPNSLIASSKILNESGGPYVKHRVRIPVSVAYGSDVDRVREIAIQSIDGIEEVCDSPPPTIRFLKMGESSLDFELRCWVVQPEARGRVIDRINMSCYRALREAGVEIPYPKRDLYVRAMPGG